MRHTTIYRRSLAATGWRASLVADCGFGRQAWLVKLLLRRLPVMGRVAWQEGREQAIPGQVVVLHAQLREAAKEDDLPGPHAVMGRQLTCLETGTLFSSCQKKLSMLYCDVSRRPGRSRRRRYVC